MTGLEKIVDIIKTDAEKASTDIQSKAKLKADALLEEAKQQIEKQRAVFDKETEKMYEIVKEKGISSAKADRNMRILEEKQKLIKQTIDLAKDKIKKMPDNKYFEKMADLACKYAHSDDGVIAFGKLDLDRLPADFMTNLSKKLAGSGKGGLELSREACDIDYGLMLIYDEIEENCAIDSLFSSQREQLEDMINSSLFAV